ncbi:transposase [Solimicrobium silvestre]|uniref:Transposase n=1 Tax=Solimicrobium silvestre TaxID=2099400 RepID=A0A2S9H211_9BURK|nr:transposase [Solimicrobium silvestre]PRC93983.1 Transposase [Solimicrobium silvestre]
MTQTDQTAAQRTLRKPHRQHSIEFKRAVAEQALQQGACITHIAREHDIRPNLVHSWRQRYREGLLNAQSDQKLLPVALIESIAPSQSDKAPVPEETSPCSGFILLNAGQISMRIKGRADPMALKLILTELLSCYRPACRDPHLAGCGHHRYARRI